MSPLWVVRLWDGFDGIWMDVSEPMSEEAAKELAGDKNEQRLGSGAGNREGSYNEIDYYKAVPCAMKMFSVEIDRRHGDDRRVQ
jgi:hypothetical protein